MGGVQQQSYTHGPEARHSIHFRAQFIEEDLCEDPYIIQVLGMLLLLLFTVPHHKPTTSTQDI